MVLNTDKDNKINKKPGWLLRLHVALAFLFLYAPIIILVIFSFNTDRRNASWQGFTFDWYVSLWHNEAILRALFNSLKVGLAASIIATIIGTLAAVGLSRYKFKGRSIIGKLVYIPLVVPEIVMGISILTLFVDLGITRSLITVILAHIAFCISYVIITVTTMAAKMNYELEDAAADLGATKWDTFRLVTLPQLYPGIISGALLSFTLSFDDFVITFLNAGVGCGTLPLAIHSMLKFGITPEINAISTILLISTFVMTIVLQWFYNKMDKQFSDSSKS
ncbi:MAG: ABC transporter permease [bacterium]|nr:ABC transporter permease [bacterium]